MISPLFNGCYRLWRRTSMHFLTHHTGSRRHESDWCLTFADNIFLDTAMPPPREIIDRMKEDLRIENGIGFTVVEGLLSNQGM